MAEGCIFLVRHGETEWNRERRYQGWRDSPLTDLGRAQAAAIGGLLARLPEAASAELVSSPIGRARDTAVAIAHALGRRGPLICDDRLREVSIGAWEGLTYGDIEALVPGIFDGTGRHEWYFRAPGGESYGTFAGRVADWLDEVRRRTVIAVTHGVVTRVLRGLYAGVPRQQALMFSVPQDRIYRLQGGAIETIRVD